MGKLTDRSWEEMARDKTNDASSKNWGRVGKREDMGRFNPRGKRSILGTLAEIKAWACVTQQNVWRFRLSPAAYASFQVEAERDGRFDSHFDLFESPLTTIWGSRVIEDPEAWWVDRDLQPKLVFGDDDS